MYEEGMLMELFADEDKFILRLNRDWTAPPGTALSKQIVTLTLRGVAAAELESSLSDAIDDYISYEVSEKSDGKYCVVMDGIELECVAANQEESDYTAEDWATMCRRLSAACNRTDTLLHQAHRFQEQLLRDIGRERDRCIRKRDFFLKGDARKVDRFDAQIQAYDRVLTIMEFLNRRPNED